MKKLLVALLLFVGCANAAEPQVDHTFGPTYVAFSPDAKKLAVAGSDGVKIYESATGRVLETRAGSSFGTHSLAWSHDGKSLAAGGLSATNAMRGEIVLWREGHPTKRWLCDNAFIAALLFSNDGKRLWSATAGDMIGEEAHGSVRIWDVNTAKLLKTVDKYFAYEATFTQSKDGKLVVCKTRKPDFERFAQFDALTGQTVKGSQLDIQRVFNTSQELLFTKQGNRAEISTYFGADYVASQYVVTNTKGKRVVSQELGNVTRKEVAFKFPYIAATVPQRYFPGYEMCLKIWKIDERTWKLNELGFLNRTLAPTRLTSTRDGKQFFIQTNKGVLQLNSATLNTEKVWPQARTETIQFPSAALSVADDGRRIFNNHWLEMASGKPREVVPSEKLSGVTSRVGTISPDGKWLLAPLNSGIALYDEKGNGRELRISDLMNGESATQELGPLLRANFSPNERQLVVAIGGNGGGSNDGLYQFDFNGKLKRRFVEKGVFWKMRPLAVRDAVFGADGSQIFAVEFSGRSEKKKEIWLYRLNARWGGIEESAIFPVNGLNIGNGTVQDLVLSPDGKTLALSAFVTENALFEPRILLFDTQTLKQKTSLPLGSGVSMFRTGKIFAFDSDNNLAILRGQNIDVWNPKTHSIVNSRLLY